MSEDTIPGTVMYRLDQLEKKVDSLEAHNREGFATLAAQAAADRSALTAQIASLAFVRVDVYASERSAIVRDIQHIRNEVKDLVTVEAFRPVRSIVYGAVGLILIGVLTALVSLVVIGR